MRKQKLSAGEMRSAAYQLFLMLGIYTDDFEISPEHLEQKIYSMPLKGVKERNPLCMAEIPGQNYRIQLRDISKRFCAQAFADAYNMHLKSIILTCRDNLGPKFQQEIAWWLLTEAVKTKALNLKKTPKAILRSWKNVTWKKWREIEEVMKMITRNARKLKYGE